MKEIMKADDERRIRWGKKWWNENEMMKGMLNGEDEMRTEKMKWEWVDERNDESRRWKENKMRKEIMKAEDERRIRWGKKWWWWEKKVDIQPWQAQGLKKGPRIKEFVRFNTKDPAPPSLLSLASPLRC